jgi:lipopolysaccharide transport system permease protein
MEQLSTYCQRLWKTRFFLLCMVKHDLQSRYRRSVMGIAWSLLHPMVMTTVLCVISQQLFHLDLQTQVPFVLSGIALWVFLSTSITEGCNSILNGERFIRSHPLPMAIYPLRTILSLSVHFLITLTLTIIVTGIVKGYENPLVLLSLPFCLLLLLVFGWAIVTLFGFLTIYFPDVQHLTQIALQILFYCTPVFYPPEIIRMRSLQAIIRYNPLGTFIELFRAPIIHGSLPSVQCLSIAVTFTLLAACLAMVTLSTQERRVIFYM